MVVCIRLLFRAFLEEFLVFGSGRNRVVGLFLFLVRVVFFLCGRSYLRVFCFLGKEIYWYGEDFVLGLRRFVLIGVFFVLVRLFARFGVSVTVFVKREDLVRF